MLTGHRVFRGAKREELMQQHLQSPIPSLSKWRRGLPAEIDRVIVKAMAKEPGQRFRSAGELANAYHEVVAPDDRTRKAFSVPSESPPSSLPPGSAGVRPLRPYAVARRDGQTSISRRRALTLIGTAGGAAVGIAAIAVFASQHVVGTPSGTANQAPTVGAAQGGNASAQGGHVLARAADVPLNSAKPFVFATSQNPGLLIHLPDNRFVAFDSTCTHTGCAVSYNPQHKLLECPCHGGVFDPARNAAVVAGPPPGPLTEIHVSLRPDGTVVEVGG